MRTFLAAGVLESLAYNLNRGIRNAKVFEIGKVFFDVAARPTCPGRLSTWRAPSPARKGSISGGSLSKSFDFFDLKGVLEGLFERFSLPLEVRRTTEPFLDRATSADIFIDGAKIGWIGEVQGEGARRVTISRTRCFARNLTSTNLRAKEPRRGRTGPYRVIPQWFAISLSTWTIRLPVERDHRDDQGGFASHGLGGGL